jgi:nitrite reductase [NAD(P)H] small subunit
MIEARWVRVSPCESIPPREGRSVTIGEREIAIFNLGPSTRLEAGPSTELGTSPSTELGASDEFLATDNQCPHKGGPLCDGILAGRAVVCPLHAWKINLDSGTIERPSGVAGGGVRTYPVRVDAGVVSVLIAPERDTRFTRASAETEKIQNCPSVHV